MHPVIPELLEWLANDLVDPWVATQAFAPFDHDQQRLPANQFAG